MASANPLLAPRSILHLMLNAAETCPAYNEHVRQPSPGTIVTACSLFQPVLSDPPPRASLEHGGGSLLGFVRAARRAARRTRPGVVHVHSPHVAVLWLLASIGSVGCRRPATVLTVHTSFPNLSTRNLLLLLISMPWFDRTVFCSEASRASFPRLLLRLLGKRATVVRNGVALERLDRVRMRTPPPRSAPIFCVMAIGRLIPIKNPGAIIEAFARIKDPTVRLVLLGDGSLRQSLERRVVMQGLRGRVEFRGLVPRDEVYRALASEADLYISMSTVEGLPIAVLEALASGIPAILSDIPSHREIAEGLDDSVQLVSGHDIDTLANGIQTLIECDRDHLRAVGMRARQHVQRRFSLTAMQEGYAAVYEDVAKYHGRAQHLHSRKQTYSVSATRR